MIYVLFFISLYFSSFFETSTTVVSPQFKKLTTSFLFCFFVLLAGCRYKTGYDWYGYMIYFENINDLYMFNLMEIGYAVLNYIFKNVFNSYALMSLVIVFINTTILFGFCKRYVSLPITALLFYAGHFFFTYNMGLTRQYIALSISLIVIHFVLQQKVISSLVFIVIACLFHKSAFITILYFVCYKIHLKKNWLLIGLVVSVFLTFGGNFLVRKIVEVFFSISFLPEFILDYKAYLVSGIWGNESKFSSGLGYLSIVVITFIVFLLFRSESKITNFVFNAVLVGLLISSFGMHITIISRLAEYFDILQVCMFVYFVQVIRRKILPSMYPAVFMIMLLYCVALPYKFTKTISVVDGEGTWSMFHPWQASFLPVENNERNERMQRINSF